MKFCVQQLLSLRDWQTDRQVYADTLEETRLAEDVGFDAVWLAEHHFSEYGICPSLAVMAAALARETRRVRLGTAVVVAPFLHPIRIAEEWAMVDVLSGGRLEFGIGRGYQPREFRGLGVSMERTRERFDEIVSIVKQAWTQDRVDHQGEFYSITDVRVFPRPVQRPHPPLWTAAVSPDTYPRAARQGFKLLTAPSFTPWDVLRKSFDAYRAAWRQTHGTDAGGDIIMNKIIHVADSSAQARADVVEPIRWFFRTQAALIADAEGVPPEQYTFYRRVRENLLALSEEAAVDHAAIVGDPEEVADKIRAHHEALGVTYFMGSFARGGIPHETVMRSMRLFGEKVIPRFA